jgi:two-component system cell cycle response regulator DivK
MSARTILYVEDNDMNRKIVRDLLRRTTYNLIEAHDGEAGVAMALEQRPDLILMDIQLPKISGMEATRPRRRRDREYLIVAITSLRSMKQKAKDAGRLLANLKPVFPACF